MGETVGYMVTWSTYCSWPDGRKIESCPVVLSDAQREAVKAGIVDEGKRAEEKIVAIAVGANHVHVVVRNTERNLSEFVGRSKAAGRKALGRIGFTGKVWARGYDKRYCFDEDAFRNRIEYVERH